MLAAIRTVTEAAVWRLSCGAGLVGRRGLQKAQSR